MKLEFAGVLAVTTLSSAAASACQTGSEAFHAELLTTCPLLPCVERAGTTLNFGPLALALPRPSLKVAQQADRPIFTGFFEQ
jgi:hypothetical protein